MNESLEYIIKTIISFSYWIKSIKNRLSQTSKYSLNVKEAKDINDLIGEYLKLKNQLEKHPEMAELPVVKDFLTKHLPNIQDFFKRHKIIYENGKYTILSPKNSDLLISKAKEGKYKKLKGKIIFLPITEAKIFDEYKNEEKIIPKDIMSIMNQLEVRYRSLIGLSFEVEKLYEQKRVDEAETVKLYIHKRYDSEGLKFCNLYLRGYLKTLFSKFYQQQQNGVQIDVNKEISNFIKNKADAIFFIHPYMKDEDITEVIQKINSFLDQKKEYIAIHSLGINVNTAMTIVSKVKTLSDTDYIIEGINRKPPGKPWEFSEVWYRGNGIEIYSLIKDK
jgi:hypothetical protein